MRQAPARILRPAARRAAIRRRRRPHLRRRHQTTAHRRPRRRDHPSPPVGRESPGPQQPAGRPLHPAALALIPAPRCAQLQTKQPARRPRVDPRMPSAPGDTANPELRPSDALRSNHRVIGGGVVHRSRACGTYRRSACSSPTGAAPRGGCGGGQAAYRGRLARGGGEASLPGGRWRCFERR